MTDNSSAKELIEIKTLMSKIMSLYYRTNNILEKEELLIKYSGLLEKSDTFDQVHFTPEEKDKLEKINHYSRLFEEYHRTDNIIRKAEIEEIFKLLNNDSDFNH